MSFKNLSKKFTYINENGASIVFEYDSGFLINKPKGIDTLSIRHSQAQGINQVGSTIQSSNVQARPVTVSGKLVGSFQAENKDRLLSVVRPDLTARLYADDYYLEVRPTATPTIEARPKFAAFQFQLLAAYPYWQKDDSASATLSGVAKRFKLWDNAKARATGGNGRWWNISGGGGIHSVSGSVATFEANDGDTMTALSAEIVPVQDLNGYSNPWPPGGGKNLLDTPTVTVAGITFTQDADGYVTANSTSDTRSWGYSTAQYKLTLPAGSYKFVWDVKTPTSSGGRGYRIYNDADSILAQGFTTVLDVSGSSSTFTLSGTTNIGVIVKQYNMVARFMVIKSTDSTTWAPYSNICPISGWTGANIVVSPTLDAQDGTTYTVSFGAAGTVYDGTLNVLTGELKSRPHYASYNGEALVGPWVSSMDVYAPGTTPTIGAEVVDLGGIVSTYQLTAQQVTLLVGENNILADTGSVSLRYGGQGTPYRFGEVVNALFINVKNDGQVPIPYTVTFKALAEVQNPKLIDAATNKYLLLNKTLVAGETVVVEITHERTYVNSSVDGECRGALDLASSFYRLAVGDNVIKPDATSGKSNLQVDIDFATEVVGISL